MEIQNITIEKKITQTYLNKLEPEFAELVFNREKSIKFLNNSSFSSREQLSDYFNVTLSSIENWIYRNNLEEYAPCMGAKSQKELDLKIILESLGFKIFNSRSILSPYELDAYNEENKIGIEFNGNY